MTEKFANRYRSPSARASWWSYAWPGAYFITICTVNRRHFLGNVTNKRMVLSPIGKLADRFWYEIPNHAHGAKLGAFQVMPNHIHGILILGVDNGRLVGGVGTRHALSLHGSQPTIESQPTTGLEPTAGSKSKPQYHPRFQNPGKNTVSSIIGGYKSVVTKQAHQLGFEFDWQFRFWDHIIRDDQEYQRINDYIENNPKNWHGDKFYWRGLGL